jgi:hypothetical protein
MENAPSTPRNVGRLSKKMSQLLDNANPREGCAANGKLFVIDGVISNKAQEIVKLR